MRVKKEEGRRGGGGAGTGGRRGGRMEWNGWKHPKIRIVLSPSQTHTLTHAQKHSAGREEHRGADEHTSGGWLIFVRQSLTWKKKLFFSAEQTTPLVCLSTRPHRWPFESDTPSAHSPLQLDGQANRPAHPRAHTGACRPECRWCVCRCLLRGWGGWDGWPWPFLALCPTQND